MACRASDERAGACRSGRHVAVAGSPGKPKDFPTKVSFGVEAARRCHRRRHHHCCHCHCQSLLPGRTLTARLNVFRRPRMEFFSASFHCMGVTVMVTVWCGDGDGDLGVLLLVHWSPHRSKQHCIRSLARSPANCVSDRAIGDRIRYTVNKQYLTVVSVIHSMRCRRSKCSCSPCAVREV